jgi:methionyl-tRNA formyltransferase
MGTPEFAVPSLRALTSRHEVFLVVTQPDKPSGRGRKLQPPPVKAEALRQELRLLQPEDANHPDVLALIQEMRPQVIVVVAYGCILKRSLLDAACIAPVNLHASLLPAYRGVSPINRAIMNGEKHTGVTTMRMDEGIDTGPILLQRRVEIGPGQTAGELSQVLAKVGAELLLETVNGLEAGTVAETPQDDSKATYAKKLKKSDGVIPWDAAPEAIVNHIRGVTPWPGAMSYLEGEALKVLEAARVDEASEAAGRQKTPMAAEVAANARPGTIVGLSRSGPVVAAGGGPVVLLRVCPQGKKPMPGTAWARGKRDLLGRRFSSPQT